MLSQAPALEWDTRREYTRASVELYYLSHAARPLDVDQLTEARCTVPMACVCKPWSAGLRLRTVATGSSVSTAPVQAGVYGL